MSEHLGREKHGPVGRGSGNSRNGTPPKTAVTDVGAATPTGPRDRNGECAPRLAPKNAQRPAAFNELILPLHARGTSVRDIRFHRGGIPGSEVRANLIGKVTDALTDELAAWQNRPLDAARPTVRIDAPLVKSLSTTVSSKLVCPALGVDTSGREDVLGLRVCARGKGATSCRAVLPHCANQVWRTSASSVATA